MLRRRLKAAFGNILCKFLLSYSRAHTDSFSFVPHDMATLISYLGGPSSFVRRLDYIHDQQITYIGNGRNASS